MLSQSARVYNGLLSSSVTSQVMPPSALTPLSLSAVIKVLLTRITTVTLRLNRGAITTRDSDMILYRYKHPDC